MKLKLEKFMNSDTSTAIDSAESALTAVEGEQTLTCALTNPVADEPGTSLVATLLDSAGAVIATRTVSYSETLEYTTEVAKVKDNRKAIYTITMDDGYLYSTQKYFEPWFEKYDLRGTTVAVYNCFKDGGSTYTKNVTPQMNREYFHEALTKGNLEIGSHSNTHTYLAENGVDKVSESTIRYETLGSIPKLESTFPGQQVLTFTAAGNAYSNNIKNILKEGFYAARGGNEGSNDLDTLDNSTKIGGMYDLKIRRVICGETYINGVAQNLFKQHGGVETGEDPGKTPAMMNKWLDDAVKNGEWVVEMWHTVAWKQNESDTEYYSDGGYRR